jgi:hypothetical protein
MAGLEGTKAIVADLEAKIRAATRYIGNVADPAKKASAERTLASYNEDLTTVLGMDSGFRPSGGTELAPKPSTGNAVIDNANLLSNILNSPLYTQAIKDAYLSDYLPGLSQATYGINATRAAEVQNSVLRNQAQAQAVRGVAGDYAARGLRTPKMVTEGIAPIQQTTERAKTAAEAGIAEMENAKELAYGKTGADEGSFISNPAAFGAVGANARRQAVGNLQALPGQYGMTQVEQNSTAPSNFSSGNSGDNYRPTGPVVYSDPKRIALQNKITAGEKYVASQQKKGNAKTVAGGTKKVNEYKAELEKSLFG